VTSVTEAQANIGDAITINGTGFTAGQAVTIDGQSVASPTFDSSTQITATVPAGVTLYADADVSVAGVTLVDAFFATDEPSVGTEIWGDDFNRYGSILDIGRTGACTPTADSVYGKRTLPNSVDTCSPDAGIFELPVGRGGTGQAIRFNYPNNAGQQNHNVLTPYHAASWAATGDGSATPWGPA
jgi:hypothetical protein